MAGFYFFWGLGLCALDVVYQNSKGEKYLSALLFLRPMHAARTRKKGILWGTLRKEGAPTALHLTPFRIVLSQSDARYPYGLGDVCFVLFVYNFFVPSWNGFCHIIIPT